MTQCHYCRSADQCSIIQLKISKCRRFCTIITCLRNDIYTVANAKKIRSITAIMLRIRFLWTRQKAQTMSHVIAFTERFFVCLLQEPKLETITRETIETFRGQRTECKFTTEKKDFEDKLPADLIEALTDKAKRTPKKGVGKVSKNLFARQLYLYLFCIFCFHDVITVIDIHRYLSLNWISKCSYFI